MKKLIQKISTFYTTLVRSATDTAYYKDVLKAKVQFSAKYYATLATLAIVVVSLIATVKGVPDASQVLNSVLEEGSKLYPEELVIEITDGKVSINQEEPYFIAAPSGLSERTDQAIQNAIVFDSEGTVDDIKNYKALFLINKSNILIQDTSNVEAFPLENLPNNTITKEKFDTSLENLKGLKIFIPFVIFGFSAIYLIFYYTFAMLFSILMSSAAIYIIGLISGLKLKIQKYIQIAMHTVTVPLLIEAVSFAINKPIPLPFWLVVANVLLGTIVVFSLKPKV